MSADNNHLKNREIQALRQEQPRPDAKGELILALLKPQRESQMSILRKATLPTLVSVAAIAGVFYVAQPRVLATPERVIKAIQDIKNYTINSFTIDGKERHLQSRTTVNGKDRKTVYYDTTGAETKGGGPSGSVFMRMNDSPMKMGFTIDVNGNLKDMSKDDIEKMKDSIHVVRSGDAKGVELHGLEGTDHKTVKIEVTKGPDGKEVKHFFVDGKEVDKLPDGVGGHIQMIKSGAAGDDHKEVKVQITKGPDGKEEKHFFVNGKEVDKLPSDVNIVVGGTGATKDQQEVKVQVTKDANGKEVKKFFVNGKEVDKLPEGVNAHTNVILRGGSTKNVKGQQGTIMLNAESIKDGKGSFSKSMAVIGNGKNGEKPMIVQSGQTSADYLINLLKDTSRWTIERGVELNGQKLDKFTLKGPISPIVLFVDPATALPKVLRFGTPMQEGMTIEDVYEYSIQPK